MSGLFRAQLVEQALINGQLREKRLQRGTPLVGEVLQDVLLDLIDEVHLMGTHEAIHHGEGASDAEGGAD